MIIDRVALPTLAGLTTLVTLGTIGPVFSSPSWIIGPAVAIAVVVLIGIILRSSNIASAYVTLIQLALGLLTVLTFYVPSSMLLYVVPTPSALIDLVDLISTGAATARSQPAPLPPNPGTSSLLALLAVPVVVIVDDCIANRRPALIGIPLLSMFAICSAIVRHPIPLWLAMLPLVGYILVLLVDQLSAHRSSVAWHTAGTSLAVAAALTAISILVGSTVSTAANLTDGGFLNTSGGHERTTNEMVARTTDLAGQLGRDEPLDLFTVTTDDPSPYYLRAVVLDSWGVEGWSFATPRDSGSTIDSLPDTSTPAATVLTNTSITVQNYADLFVPTYYLPRAVSLESGTNISYDTTMQVLFGEEKEQLQGEEYSVTSAVPRPTETELQAAAFDDAPGPTLSRDLAEPSDVDESVIELTEQVTGAAQTPWEVALALDAFFSDEFGGWTYSLSVPDPADQDPLASFLTKRIGYCEQYASAMAAMFRLSGVPARVAIGYTNGEQQEDLSYQITTNDAHAWVEAYFGGVGWVPFDPTPIGSRAVPLPYVPSDQLNPDNEPAPPSEAAPPTGAQAPPEDQAAAPEDDASQADGSSGSNGLFTVLRWTLIGVLGVAVLMAPAAWRSLRLRSRTSVAAAGGIAGAHAAWDELVDYARDLGASGDSTRTVRQQAARWKSEFGLDDSALGQISSGEERARYDVDPQIDPLDEPLEQARDQLADGVQPGRRLRARLWPASLLRRR